MRVLDDAWLAELMARPVFRLDECKGQPQLDALLAHLRAQKGAFYYAKIDAKEVEWVRQLSAIGFFVADTNVTLELTRPGKAPPSPVGLSVGPLDPKDEAALLEVAEHTYELSRFHLDPLIPNAVANRIKREWAANYSRKRRGDHLFVAHQDGRPVGFLAALTQPDSKTAVIDLVGVAASHRSRGVGSALVNAFVEHYRSLGGPLRVGTQVANIPSLRMYERLGFSIIGSQYVLHHHSAS